MPWLSIPEGTHPHATDASPRLPPRSLHFPTSPNLPSLPSLPSRSQGPLLHTLPLWILSFALGILAEDACDTRDRVEEASLRFFQTQKAPASSQPRRFGEAHPAVFKPSSPNAPPAVFHPSSRPSTPLDSGQPRLSRQAHRASPPTSGASEVSGPLPSSPRLPVFWGGLLALGGCLLGWFLAWKGRGGAVLSLLVGTFFAGFWLGEGSRAARERFRLIEEGLVERKAFFLLRVTSASQEGTHGGRSEAEVLGWKLDALARWQGTEGRIALHWSGPWKAGRERFLRGSRVWVKGRLRFPRRYADPSVGDPWVFRKRQGTLLQIAVKAEAVILVALEQGLSWTLLRGVDRLRMKAGDWLSEACKEPDVRGLLKALLLGERASLRPAIVEAFSRLGLSHLLAISGLHLALLASMGMIVFGRLFSFSMWLLTRGLVEKAAVLAVFPLVLGYTLLSGAAISTQRAFVMICFFFVSLLLDRGRVVGISLSLAAFVILLADPTALFSMSFQLSFLAVWILAFLLPSFLPNPSPSPFLASLWERLRWAGYQACFLPALSSLIVMLGTLPLTVSWSPYFPWLGVFVNPIAIPLCGFGCVTFGLLALLLAPVCPPLASLCLWIATLASQILLEGALAWASFASVTLPLSPFLWYEALALALALGSVPLLRQATVTSFRWGLAALLLAGLLSCVGLFEAAVRRGQTPSLILDILDVGQGDSIAIRFPSGQRMLVDAGGEAFAPVDPGQRLLLPYFRAERASVLDVAVLSHPHPDHFGGFASLLEVLPTREFWRTQMRGDHPGYATFRKALGRSKAKVVTFPRPSTRWFGSVRVDILHPFPPKDEGDSFYWGLHANDNSLVLLLTYGTRRILLTGDLEKRGEAILLERWPSLQVDLLKIGHHGSRTSSTDSFLDAIRPKAAVVSLGRHNLFRFPHPEIRKRFATRHIPVWRTDQCGRLRVTTDGHDLRITPHLRPCQSHTFP